MSLRFTSLLMLGTLLSGSLLTRGVAQDQKSVTLDVPGGADATPSIAAAGSFVVVAWGVSAGGKADVFAATSRDGGVTFGSPVRVNRIRGEGRLGGELPPRVAVHRGAGPAPTITVLWTARGAATEIKVAQSSDGGVTFGAPRALQASGAAGDRGWTALAAGPDGDAHAVWLDHRGLAARRAAGDAAGKSGSGHHAHASGAPADGSLMAQGSAIYHASVGQSVRNERAITTGVCYCCKTAIAAAADGTLFAAWRHVYPGDLRDIALSVSRDGGRSFSAPARVSEDGWAINGCPDDGPSVAVGQDGTAHIVWPSVIGRDDPEGALFYASTRDGQRFTARQRIPTLGSPKPMHPQIALAPGGKVVVAWDELLKGARVAAVRTLTPRGDGSVQVGEATRLAPAGGASHPVVSGTAEGVVAAWATGGDDSRVAVRRLRFAR